MAVDVSAEAGRDCEAEASIPELSCGVLLMLIPISSPAPSAAFAALKSAIALFVTALTRSSLGTNELVLPICCDSPGDAIWSPFKVFYLVHG